MTGAIAAYSVTRGRIHLNMKATDVLDVEDGDMVLVFADGDELRVKKAPGKVLKRPDGELVLEEDLVS